MPGTRVNAAADGLLQSGKQVIAARHTGVRDCGRAAAGALVVDAIRHEARSLLHPFLVCLESRQHAFVDKQFVHLAVEVAEVIDDVAFEQLVEDQFDLDAVQVLWMLRRMRDEEIYLDGRKIKNPPMFFLGAASSPFGTPPKYEAIRVEKKINAGAQFIQTQPVFDFNRFLDWLEELDKRNLLGKAYLLPGLVPLRSKRAAQFMANEVPGISIPKHYLKRMDEAGDKVSQEQTGIAIALELIEKLKETTGINGIHIMAVHWEQIVPHLVKEANIPNPIYSTLEQSQAEKLSMVP